MRNIFFYSLILIPLFSYSFDKKCEKSLSTRKKSFRKFEQAQEYVQDNNIKSGPQYRELKKNGELPDDMPSDPRITYRDKGWKGWRHFLGTEFRKFEQAQEYVQDNNIKSGPQYRELKKNGELPDDMPSDPRITYRDKGWKGWRHFLGTEFRSFEQAQEYVQDNNIKSGPEYRRLHKEGKLPKDMPSNPDTTYKNKGWIDWGHFLGTNQAANSAKQFRSFKDAQHYVQQNNIGFRSYYNEMKKNGELPDDMPSNPNKTYKNKGWINWNHFLGTEPSIYHNRQFKDFAQAQEYIQPLNITSETQYHQMKKNGELPDDIPFNPNKTYKNKGWIDWGHFLGTNQVANSAKQFKKFDLAQQYVQQKGITIRSQYKEMKKNGELPDDMPSNPNETYKNKGWKGWKYFLGTIKIMSFKRAQNYALNTEGIETVEELIKWLKSKNRPPNFPEEPHKFYKEWTNARNFLKVLKVRDLDKMNYLESKEYMQNLYFKNKREAIMWLISNKRTEEMPVDPHIFYGKEWEGWDTYLGLSPTVEDLFDRLLKKDTNGTTLDIQEIDYEEEFISDEYD